MGVPDAGGGGAHAGWRTVDVYVPRRFRGGGLDGIPAGAGIVGTPGEGALVEIDFEDTSPAMPDWGVAVCIARRRRLARRRDEPRRAHPTELHRVGSCDRSGVTVTDAEALERWLEAGRDTLPTRF
jgi:hypothetical protein